MNIFRSISVISVSLLLAACASSGPQQIPIHAAAGCGTILSIEPVNEAPELFNPLEKSESNIGAGEPAMILNAFVPGLGSLASVGIAVGASMTADAVVNNSRKKDIGNAGTADKPDWKGVYRISLQPDFGEPFTFTLMGVSRSLGKGDRVVTAAQFHLENNYYLFGKTSTSFPDKELSNRYVLICYGQGQRGFHQGTVKNGRIVDAPLPQPVLEFLIANKKIDPSTLK